MNAPAKNRHALTRLLIACGVWLVGRGLYSISLRPPPLPEDPRCKLPMLVHALRRATPLRKDEKSFSRPSSGQY